ncbi:MAG: riboflavin synthase [Dehalococcoidales bacterium]|nr:riboflavin synthase [Dehalococcoidales bacterium]
MFTGIVEETGTVISKLPSKLAIRARVVMPEIKLGDSMAVNGVCLTVTRFDADSFAVDIMPETTQRTNLGALKNGDKVNLERPLTLNGRLGGHLVQGHVDGTGRVSALEQAGEALLIRIATTPDIMKYVVEKGFIAVDGISLTIVSRDTGSFQVSIVDFTRKNTILGEIKVGDTVNLEADIIAKYVEQFNHPRQEGITADFLSKHGFVVK